MFDFLEEIGVMTGLPFEILNGGYKIINFSNKSIYVENYKNISTFLSNEVKIKLPRGILIVNGENLKLKKLNKDSLVLIGKINSFRVE